MTYKLMAADIDGTLLNNKSELTENTRETIKRAVDAGLFFTIASGRPIQGIEGINRQLNLDVPYITYNGAMVIMGKNREILYERYLTQNDAKDIIGLAEKHKVTYMVWKDNQLYVPEYNEIIEKYMQFSKVKPVKIESIEKLTENGVTKILWHDDAEKIVEHQNQLGQYLSANVNFHASLPIYLEFVDKKASKGIALEQLGNYFDIKKSEIIAVGDGFNDISMIEYAGLGVAMGNAPDAVKEKADYITLSNEEDGLAHVINKLILNI